MAKKGITIAIRKTVGSKPRKLTKIISYGKDGFGVVTPYHREQSGYVAKLPFDYNKLGNVEIPTDEVIGFTAESRVKLSYHADGFAQFSGEVSGTVISGRDSYTGEPKGVGLLTQPLSDPIRTGPSVGVSAWGLDDFDEMEDAPEAIVFEPDEVYHRGCRPDEANAWVLEVFAFPLRYWAAIRKRATGYYLTMSFRDFEASGGVLEMKVFDMPDLEVILAGFVSRFKGTFPSTSGWVLNGPGNKDASGKGHVLIGCYPRDALPVQGVASLDRPPDSMKSGKTT